MFDLAAFTCSMETVDLSCILCSTHLSYVSNVSYVYQMLQCDVSCNSCRLLYSVVGHFRLQALLAQALLAQAR